MTSNGYVKLHRAMLEWEWYKDQNTKAVFLHLLMTASYKDNEFCGHHIKPGQVVCGRKQLARDLGLSESTIRTSLKHLILTNEITIKPTNKFSIITIENWGKYQLCDDDINQQINQQLNHQLTSKTKKINHTIRKKESKNRESAHTPTFEDVKEYVDQMGYTMDPAAFYDYYESIGWVRKNGQRIKDWKASVRTWERREKQYHSQGSNNKPIIEPPKYKQFGPEPRINAVQMPDEVRSAVNKILK